jgi:hypothetical protein
MNNDLNSSSTAQKRAALISELIETEEHYIEDLRILIEVFLQPLKKVLSKQEIFQLFSNVEALLPVNEGLLVALKQPEAHEKIGEIFCEKGDLLKLYAVYCSNQPFTNSRIKEFSSKYKEFKVAIEKAFENPRCRNLGFDSFLIAPMQRVTKYPMLLQELLRKTSPTHPDYRRLETASKHIREIVDLINERTRASENVQKLADIEAKLIDCPSLNLVQQKRILLHQGTLHHIVNKQSTPRWCFLFNDLMLICNETISPTNPNEKKYAVKQVIDLGDTCRKFYLDNSYEIEPSVGGPTSPRKNEHNFQIVYASMKNGKFVEKKLKFQAASKVDRDVWVHNFKIIQRNKTPIPIPTSAPLKLPFKPKISTSSEKYKNSSINPRMGPAKSINITSAPIKGTSSASHHRSDNFWGLPVGNIAKAARSAFDSTGPTKTVQTQVDPRLRNNSIFLIGEKRTQNSAASSRDSNISHRNLTDSLNQREISVNDKEIEKIIRTIYSPNEENEMRSGTDSESGSESDTETASNESPSPRPDDSTPREPLVLPSEGPSAVITPNTSPAAMATAIAVPNVSPITSPVATGTVITSMSSITENTSPPPPPSTPTKATTTTPTVGTVPKTPIASAIPTRTPETPITTGTDTTSSTIIPTAVSTVPTSSVAITAPTTATAASNTTSPVIVPPTNKPKTTIATPSTSGAVNVAPVKMQTANSVAPITPIQIPFVVVNTTTPITAPITTPITTGTVSTSSTARPTAVSTVPTSTVPITAPTTANVANNTTAVTSTIPSANMAASLPTTQTTRISIMTPPPARASSQNLEASAESSLESSEGSSQQNEIFKEALLDMFKIFDSLQISTKFKTVPMFTESLKMAIKMLIKDPPSNLTSMSREEARKIAQRINELVTEDPKIFVRRRVEEILNKEQSVSIPTPTPTSMPADLLIKETNIDGSDF